MESKSIQNVMAYMEDEDIKYENLTNNGVTLLAGDFNLNDKQLRGLIGKCFKNGFKSEFENNKFYISKGLF